MISPAVYEIFWDTYTNYYILNLVMIKKNTTEFYIFYCIYEGYLKDDKKKIWIMKRKRSFFFSVFSQ